MTKYRYLISGSSEGRFLRRTVDIFNAKRKHGLEVRFGHYPERFGGTLHFRAFGNKVPLVEIII